jgi:hypothetical protein
MRAAGESMGGLPPVVLATLRDKMVGLSVEIGDGAVWANASRSRMAHSLSLVPDERLADGFSIGNMIPTVIDDDIDAARARNRKTLQGYVALPNYRNYWIEAGYEAEMAAVQDGARRQGCRRGDGGDERRWLDDCTLSGSVGRCATVSRPGSMRASRRSSCRRRPRAARPRPSPNCSTPSREQSAQMKPMTGCEV